MKLAHAVGITLVFVGILAGCTTPPPEPSPTVSAPSAAEPEWHLIVERTFPDNGAERVCTIRLRVERTSNASTPEDVEAAVALLHETDWTSVDVSLDEFAPEDLAARREQGIADAQLLSMLVSDRIHSALAEGGYSESGASTESSVECEPA